MPHSKPCDPRDIATKALFLGPQSENAVWFEDKWLSILKNWLIWRKNLFPGDGRAISETDRKTPSFIERQRQFDHALSHLLHLLESETPKFTPRYIGHMVSEISMPAILGHVATLLHNPNNTSHEVSRVGTIIEKEAIQDLLTMVGFDSQVGRGHFTSGGTIANFESMWRARYRLDHWLSLITALKTTGALKSNNFFKLAHCGWQEFNHLYKTHQPDENLLKKNSWILQGPWNFQKIFKSTWNFEFEGPVVLVAGNRHFSWPKAVSIFGLGEEAFWPIELDHEGRLDVNDLEIKINRAEKAKRPILMVVSIAGTTEMGEVDPVGKVQDLLDRKKTRGIHIWHHVDAAYGGYFCTMLDQGEIQANLSPYVAESLAGIARVDSVTLDPHKLGYVPYSCGAILFKSVEHYQVSSFDAPYLKKENKSTWAFTMEGSRPASGATATWLSNRCIGLNSSGYGRILEKGLIARKELIQTLKHEIPEILIAEPTDLNIVCISLAKNGEPLSKINNRTLGVFKKFEDSPNFSVSKTSLSMHSYKKLIHALADKHSILIDTDHLYLLRIVLMNPFVISKETQTDFIKDFVTELSGFNK